MNARTIRCAAVLFALAISVSAVAQELVISTANGQLLGGPGPLVVIGDLAHELPVPAPYYVAPITPGYPDGQAINPHGLALLSRDKAVGTHSGTNGDAHFVDIVDLPTASLDGWFFPGGASDTTYTGLGSAALAPDGAYLLLASGSSVAADRTKLFVVPTPISSTSISSDVIDLPGDFGTAQTHGIVFDPLTQRAYVGHTNGITAIDPPYTSANVAFTIPLPPITNNTHTASYSVELSPDSSMLLAAGGQDGTLRIVHAPFQAGSNYQTLTISGAQGLDGIAITPDGSQALVVDAFTPQAFAVSAPFSPSSSVETLSMAGLSFSGFEDLAISPDGQYAALTGQGSAYLDDPLIVLRAPFTEAGVSAYAVPLVDVGSPYGPAGRGAGTVRFWSDPADLPPQVRINRTSVTEGDVGTTPAILTVTLSRPSSQTVSVDYATTDVTAHAGIDYQTTAGTLSFPPGAVERTISVPLIGNTLSQGAASDLWFRVVLSNGINAVVIQAPGYDFPIDGRCTIVDDDRGYIATPPLPDATVGVPYSVTFTTLNVDNPHAWTIHDTQPAGLHMDYATGILSGIPTLATVPGDPLFGYFSVNVQGNTSVQEREYHLTVRTDRIFANGFEANGDAQPPLEPIATRQPRWQSDAAPFDPSMATSAASSHR